MLIKAGITSQGFRTAVKDYTEPTVVEELVANSYDADATIALVLLDTISNPQVLYVIDNGVGFNENAILEIATLGAGDKSITQYSNGNRFYLGSYGYGLKSSLNIAHKAEVISISKQSDYKVIIDWNKLDDALKENFEGYSHEVKDVKKTQKTGTIIKLYLKNPTAKNHLDKYGEVLANLPSDKGKFKCYYGLFSDVSKNIEPVKDNLGNLEKITENLFSKDLINIAGSTNKSDIDECERMEIVDKNDKNVKAIFYFTGIKEGKVKPLKIGLRGIYIRIHGRLLKQSFTDRKYTYYISNWVQFEIGLRVEITIDWLRDQITLSREGIRFSNPKLEDDFTKILNRLISRFIQPLKAKLERKKLKEADKKFKQRLELAKKRIDGQKDTKLPIKSLGFEYKPETDCELAMVLSQKEILKKINANYVLIDYNDQAPFDCILYDMKNLSFINTELEPTLMEFLSHNETKDIRLIIVWSRGKWRIGAKKRGKRAFLELTNSDKKLNGYYKLLEYSSEKVKNPKNYFEVIVLEEILNS